MQKKPPSSAEGATRVAAGERAARRGELRLGCSAVLFSPTGDRVLLTRRRDNGRWCLPGGRVDPGESAAEACAREVLEETGIEIRVRRLIGVYSNPNLLVIYPDGNQAHVVVLCFEVERLSGVPTLSSETLAIDYVPVSEAAQMDLFHGHAQQLRDAQTGQAAAFVR